MTKGRYETILETAVGDSRSFGRAASAYRQMVPFAIAHQRLAADVQAEPGDIFPRSEHEKENFTKAVWIGEQMDAMLRATIVFGDVTNLVLLQEVLGIPGREPFVTYLSSVKAPKTLRHWASRIDRDAFVAAHALRVYRNQLVMHFTQIRTNSAVWKTGEMMGRRLVPIHFDGATPDAHATLEQIAKRNRDLPRVAEVREVTPGQHNFWELLEALFYSISPLNVDGDPNSDRTFIDRIVVHGGVRSPTMSEVFEIVTNFASAVIARVVANDLPAP